MIEQYVSASSLSCLLNEDSSVEIVPEPFRMQYAVSFRVAYSEYINYILSLKDDSGIRLMSEISYLRNLASTSNPKLYSCFLQDIAFAIYKELCFAERYRRDASVIIPSSYSAPPLNVTDCLKSYIYCKDIEQELVNKATQAGFILSKVERSANIPLFQLSVVLYQLSKVTTKVKEISLVYDLR